MGRFIVQRIWTQKTSNPILVEFFGDGGSKKNWRSMIIMMTMSLIGEKKLQFSARSIRLPGASGSKQSGDNSAGPEEWSPGIIARRHRSMTSGPDGACGGGGGGGHSKCRMRGDSDSRVCNSWGLILLLVRLWASRAGSWAWAFSLWAVLFFIESQKKKKKGLVWFAA